MNLKKRKMNELELRAFITLRSKVTNSGAARDSEGLALPFFVYSAGRVSRTHIALYFQIR